MSWSENLWPPRVPLALRWRFRRRVAECRMRLEQVRDEALNEWPDLTCRLVQENPRHLPVLLGESEAGWAVVAYDDENEYHGPGWCGARKDRPDKAARHLIDTVWAGKTHRAPH